jgi:hypothetical protein
VKVSWSKPGRAIVLIDVLGLSALAALLVARFIPVARLPFWGCAFRKLTGWPCPACGLTRVMDRLAHFNVPGAWDANPLGAVGALALVALGLVSLLHLMLKLPLPQLDLDQREVRLVRIAVVLSVLINYAFVIIKTKFPALL